MREPRFWWQPAGVEAVLLSPFAALYGAVAGRRLRRAGARAGVPVICVGNPTVGGAGKTPTALKLAAMLKAAGERPAFLSRGYGGRLRGPLRVDPSAHTAAEVGDEPLLLARVAPTVVARDRVRGAQAAAAAAASVIVMDDGFQNPSLAKDLSVLVVDARRALGNGKVFPAGPLRAALDGQFERAQVLILVGDDPQSELEFRAHRRAVATFRARLVPDAGFVAAIGGGRALAFAGIGDPDKFFATLRAAGVTVAAARGFPDHHRYSAADAAALIAQADRDGLVLVTTEKDIARMQGDPATAQLADAAHALPVTLAFDDEDGFDALMRERIAAARQAGR